MYRFPNFSDLVKWHLPRGGRESEFPTSRPDSSQDQTSEGNTILVHFKEAEKESLVRWSGFMKAPDKQQVPLFTGTSMYHYFTEQQNVEGTGQHRRWDESSIHDVPTLPKQHLVGPNKKQ